MREFIRTAGFVNSDGHPIGVNLFYYKSEDASILGGGDLTEGHNLIIIGLWGKESQKIARFGEAVETIMEKANMTSSKFKSRKKVINRQIKAPIVPHVSKAVMKGERFLKTGWNFVNNTQIRDLPQADPKMLLQIATCADQHKKASKYYFSVFELLIENIVEK